jgi:ankyrin repeat protein
MMNLNKAVKKGELDSVKQIISDPNFSPDNFKNAIHKAVLHCDIANAFDKDSIPEREEIIKVLTECGFDLNIPDKEGSYPLHLTRNINVVKLLVNKGADVNVKDELGRTPLHHLCNVAGAVDLLIMNGAEINTPDKFKKTPLHKSVDLNMLDYKIDSSIHGSTQTTKISVDLPGVGSLLKHGADLSLKDNKGNTALHYAARCKFVYPCEKLAEAGAELNVKNNEGDSPLDIAIAFSKVCADYLKGLGAVYYKKHSITDHIKGFFKQGKS